MAACNNTTSSAKFCACAMLTLFLISCLIGGLEASSKAEYYSLIDDLFTGYKKEVRPSNDYSSASTVTVRMWLLTIDDLEEQDQVFVTSMRARVRYDDINLEWAPSSYGNITRLVYPQDSVWLPDIVVENSVEDVKSMGYKGQPLLIEYTGIVTWWISHVLRTSCSIDITFYPFDTQTCEIIMTTWVSNKDDININMENVTSGGVALDMSYFSTSGSWHVVSSEVSELPNENDVTRVSFSIKMSRRRMYYVVNILLPVMALTLTASLVFALPADAGEKMGTSITVLLAYAVYLSIISDSMPKTSLQTSWLSVYLSLLLASTALAVIFSVIVLRLHHVPAHIPVGPALRKFVIRTRSSLLLTALEEADESKDASDGAHQKYYNFGSQDSSGISGGGFGGKRNGKIFPEERPQTAFTLADNLSQDGLTSADDDAVESKRPAPPPEVVVTWQNVAETADRMLFICFTVYNVGCTAVCVSYLTFASP